MFVTQRKLPPPAELGIVKAQVEKSRAPDSATAKAAAVRALADAERGVRNAANQIRERGGLPKSNGTEDDA